MLFDWAVENKHQMQFRDVNPPIGKALPVRNPVISPNIP